MSQPREHTEPARAWCGRSWEGLVDRRREAFAHSLALKAATEHDCHDVVSTFLEFFDATGAQLMRDEEEWIFAALRPTPNCVIKALEEHIEMSSLIRALVNEASAGCLDLRVVHRLGALIEVHLLMEEEELRPLVTPHPRLTLAR